MYILRTPGLTGDDGSVSFESVDHPGFYLRHYSSKLFLEDIRSPRNRHIYKKDATFYIRPNKYHQVDVHDELQAYSSY